MAAAWSSSTSRWTGYTALSQATIGFQLGGQKYAQFIFFKDETALDHFRRGNFEFGAQASAVAITAGASADANYDSGVAIFTDAGGGLMFEGSVGGQRFSYEAKGEAEGDSNSCPSRRGDCLSDSGSACCGSGFRPALVKYAA